MYAYEHAFSDEEVMEWLERQLERYRRYGYGLWAVILKENGEMIGQCGLTMQDCDKKEVAEVGYLFRKAYWHRGYASEAAIACRDYAFNTLHIDEIYSIVRDTNKASIAVAKRNGMTARGVFTKHYYGMDMPHLIFSMRREDIASESGKGSVRRAEKEDIGILAGMALLLWPGHTIEELSGEFEEIIVKNEAAFFLAYEQGRPVGFSQCQIRHDYVEGTQSSPVGYLEGIYVKEECRNRGYAKELLRQCEKWAVSKGCGEFASDCELDNADSLRFHRNVGFTEANRIICFTKTL